jgi:hypothetical protein
VDEMGWIGRWDIWIGLVEVGKGSMTELMDRISWIGFDGRTD